MPSSSSEGHLHKSAPQTDLNAHSARQKNDSNYIVEEKDAMVD